MWWSWRVLSTNFWGVLYWLYSVSVIHLTQQAKQFFLNKNNSETLSFSINVCLFSHFSYAELWSWENKESHVPAGRLAEVVLVLLWATVRSQTNLRLPPPVTPEETGPACSCWTEVQGNSFIEAMISIPDFLCLAEPMLRYQVGDLVRQVTRSKKVFRKLANEATFPQKSARGLKPSSL